LTSLQPLRIRVANTFSVRAFSVWPAKWRVLQRAVCHLAACIDNTIIITSVVLTSSFYLNKRSLVMVSFNFKPRMAGLDSAVEN